MQMACGKRKTKNMQHAGKNCAKASTPKLIIKYGIVLGHCDMQ